MFRSRRYLLVAASAFLAGCGSSEQQYIEGPVVQTTKSQQIRDTLQGYAQTGVLDSGVEVLGDELEALRAEGVSNVDELKQDYEKLKSAKGPAAVKKAAEAMLAKLPKDSAPPAAS